MIYLELPFNKILFNLTRLDIIGNLDSWATPIPFTELRDVMKITDGNLSSHLKVLRVHELVIIRKGFRERKPHTTIELTVKGQEEFKKLKAWFYHTFIENS